MSKKVTTESFIEGARKIHGDDYDYSKTNYKKAIEKVIIICPKHGEFLQTPNSHLQGCGCPKCKNEQTGLRCRHTIENFIEKAIIVHNSFYDYSKAVSYNGNKEKVEIICPIHGSFFQTAQSHLSGCGCPKCKGDKISKLKTRTRNDFINRAELVHEKDKHDYSKVIYIDCKTPVEIICNKCKTSFWQDPTNHLQGKGCPRCSSSKLENLIRKNLNENGIEFEEQRTWEWLVYKNSQYVDFFLPQQNLVIECQGIQHFEEINFFGGEKGFEETKNRDNNKLKLCTEHGISVIYVSNLGENYPYPYEVITNINILIDKIKLI